MQFAYELVSPKELTKTEKILLACKGKEFYFIRHNGVVKINKALPKPKTLVKIADAMWQFDHLLDCDESWQMDELWQRVKRIAGEDAAVQLSAAWSEALHEKLDAEDKRDAAEWLQAHSIPDELDAVSDTIGVYRSGFIKALWSLTMRADAIFLYGYQVGMEAAQKAVLA